MLGLGDLEWEDLVIWTARDGRVIGRDGNGNKDPLNELLELLALNESDRG
jgi:hypothetical protein